ncbi:MAG TPA: rod shape-determining protein MreD [Chloroflexia bacterium]|jgi:rod shape-determining protein MreD|nr:rod shape-determining protein MreD [Chloroflexia bacterium]
MLTLVGLSLVLLAGLVQATVLPILLPQVAHIDVRPDLVILLVVAVTLADGLREAVIWAFCGGLLLDLLSTLPLGSSALCLLLVVLLARLASSNPFRAHLIMPLGMVFVCTLFYYLLLLSLRTLLGQHFAWLSALGGVVLPTALFNVALMPLVYTFVLWLVDRFRPVLPEEWQ